MAAFVSRKKTRQSRKREANEAGFFRSFFEKFLFRVPAAMFLLALIYVWSSSMTLFSGNVVHVCVSSRKLSNLYCLSAGTQPDFRTPVSLPDGDHHISSSAVINAEESKEVADFRAKIDDIVPVVANDNSTSSVDGGISTLAANTISEKVRNETLDYAYTEVEGHLRTHRSWISNSSHTTCEGRGIYVYDLPSKFNKDLLAQCKEMTPWEDFCSFLSNDALGEPIPELGRGWHNTHQYSLEPIFHARISKHPCRVLDTNRANLFYVPYYGGLDVLRWHFKNVSNEIKDSTGSELVSWLESQGSWYKNSGKDHVFVLGKISWDFRRNENEKSSWGTRLLELDQMQNPIKLLIERHPWHVNDVGIPHPTYFHPKTDEDIVTWQMKVGKSSRGNLVGFAGAARDGIRKVLIEQCVGNGECEFLNCTSGGCDRAESIVGLFANSEFCLQPPGDSPTRKSVFDSLVSGCIPVMFDPFTAYYQYPWHLPEDWDKYSVFVDGEEVRKKGVDVVERLRRIPVRERENMRRYIVYELLPGLVYGDLDSEFHKFQDAFSITVDNLLDRVSRFNQV